MNLDNVVVRWYWENWSPADMTWLPVHRFLLLLHPHRCRCKSQSYYDKDPHRADPDRHSDHNRIRRYLQLKIRKFKLSLKAKLVHWAFGGRTFASFPVVSKHVAFRAGTKVRSQSVETRVRASAVASCAFVDILTRMAITGQLSAEHSVTTASVRAVSIRTNVLTRSVPVA